MFAEVGMSTTTVTDNSAATRYEISADGATAGYVEYHLHGTEMALLHTQVDKEYSGRGLGEALIRATLDDARNRDLHVLPYCGFIRNFIAKNQDYLDLVSPEDRDRFDL